LGIAGVSGEIPEIRVYPPVKPGDDYQMNVYNIYARFEYLLQIWYDFFQDYASQKVIISDRQSCTNLTNELARQKYLTTHRERWRERPKETSATTG
jgi:hypothetical protein